MHLGYPDPECISPLFFQDWFATKLSRAVGKRACLNPLQITGTNHNPPPNKKLVGRKQTADLPFESINVGMAWKFKKK